MNLNQFQQEAFEALSTRTVDALASFIEKWVPDVSNTVLALQNQNRLLELAITEAEEAET